jgi:hypothetical protein
MAKRRSRLASGLSNLFGSVSQMANLYGQHLLQKDRWQDQERQRVMAQLTEAMLEHPDRADQIAEAARTQWGLDLSSALPSDARLTAPLHAQIASARSELELPSMDALIQQLKALGRPSLLQVGVGRSPMRPGAEPTLPSREITAEGIGPMRPAQEPVLPSREFGPSAGPVVSSLRRAREGKLDAFETQRALEIKQKGDLAESEAMGRELGTEKGLQSVLPQALDREKRTYEARELGQYSPAVTEARAAHERGLTPALAERAYAIAAAQERARYIEGEMLNQLPPEYQGAFAAATSRVPATRRPFLAREMVRLWREGDEKGMKERIKQFALDTENVDMRNRVIGRRETLRALDDAERVIREAQAAGVPFNWASGTLEDLKRTVGKTSNKRYVYLRQRLSDALINYRRAATGVQFSVREARDYQQMFPNYKWDVPVNVQLIRGLRDSLKANDYEYWKGRLGEQGAALVGVDDPAAAPAGVSYTEYLSAIGGQR